MHSSRAKRNLPISSHLPCLGMGAHRKEADFRVGCVGAGFYVFLFHLRPGVGGPLPTSSLPNPPNERNSTWCIFSVSSEIRAPLGPLGPLALPWFLPGPPWAVLGPLWALPWSPGPWSLGPWAHGPQKPMTAAKKTNDSSQKNQDSSKKNQ